MGYMDPEYFLTLRLTTKSDVYSFGVVMFEALCGRRAVDLSLDEEQWSLARWAQHCIDKGTLHQIIDPNLRWEILPESLTEFAHIANQCLCYYSKKRPTMTQVMGSLELALALQVGHRDSSTFEMEIFCRSEADENLEKVDSTTVQDEAIKFGSYNEDSKDILQSHHVNPTKRKTLTNMLQPFMFCTVQEASEEDIPRRFLDEEMFLKEKRDFVSRLQSSRTAGGDLTQGGSEFEEKVAMLVGLGFRRVAVTLALKFFHVNYEAVKTAVKKALQLNRAIQARDGHWPAENAGPLFFTPPLNDDGGWGFYIEGHNTMIGLALSYVALRLLGEGPDDGNGVIDSGRKWILDHRGATGIPYWGKTHLSINLL
ncbi:hypothetical protein LguiB_014320 [Lonicera macranthoides]